MSLQERMERLRCRHTYGSHGPVFFLLHKEDYSYVEDLIAEEREKSRYYPGPKEDVYFRGIKCLVSPLADKGTPMAVVRDTNGS